MRGRQENKRMPIGERREDERVRGWERGYLDGEERGDKRRGERERGDDRL